MLVGIILFTVLMLVLLLTVIPMRNFFSFAKVEILLMAKAVALGFISVIWIEGYKFYLRSKD